MAARAKLTPIAGALASVMIMGLAAAPAHGAGNQGGTSAQSATGTDAQASRTSDATMGQQQQQPQRQQQRATMSDLRASTLMGKDVRNAQGEELGEIDDLVLDLSNNRVHYAILSRGGVLGIGDKQVAVPVSRIQGNAQDHELILNMTEQQLKDAPGLERNVEWNNPRTWDNIGQYYTRTLGMPASERPSAQAGQGGQAMRFSRARDVLGMDVIDSTGDEVGEIEDVVVNLTNGRIHYAVLEFDRAWNPNDKLVALPLTWFKPQAGANDLVINMSREQLATAPSFEMRDWPDLSDRTFRDRVAGFGRSSATGMEPRASANPDVLAIVIIDDTQFGRLDTNRDGRLSRDEAKSFTRLTENWNSVDRNRDGYLTPDELNGTSASAARASGSGSSTSAGTGTTGSAQGAAGTGGSQSAKPR